MTASGLDLRRGALVGVAVMATLSAALHCGGRADAGAGPRRCRERHDRHLGILERRSRQGVPFQLPWRCRTSAAVSSTSTGIVRAFSFDKGHRRLVARQLRRTAPARRPGNAVIRAYRGRGGIYDGFAPGEGRYVLQSAATAPMHRRGTMVGDWAIARGTGKPICVLTW